MHADFGKVRSCCGRLSARQLRGREAGRSVGRQSLRATTTKSNKQLDHTSQFTSATTREREIESRTRPSSRRRRRVREIERASAPPPPPPLLGWSAASPPRTTSRPRRPTSPPARGTWRGRPARRAALRLPRTATASATPRWGFPPTLPPRPPPSRPPAPTWAAPTRAAPTRHGTAGTGTPGHGTPGHGTPGHGGSAVPCRRAAIPAQARPDEGAGVPCRAIGHASTPGRRRRRPTWERRRWPLAGEAMTGGGDGGGRVRHEREAR